MATWPPSVSKATGAVSGLGKVSQYFTPACQRLLWVLGYNPKSKGEWPLRDSVHMISGGHERNTQTLQSNCAQKFPGAIPGNRGPA